MPRAYSTDLRMRVIAAMQASATYRAVAASFDIAPSTAGKSGRVATNADGEAEHWFQAAEFFPPILAIPPI